MKPAAYILALLTLAWATGCGRGEDDPRRRSAELFGDLPGLSETPDPPLRDELARLVDEGGTPALLGRSTVADADNAAVALMGLFKPHAIPRMLRNAREIFPTGRFRFDPARLERAIHFRHWHEDERVQARAALARPACDFPIEYTAGFAADLSCVEVVRLCVDLEAFHAAEQLFSRDDVAGAIDSLEVMFRLTAHLAAVKHPTVRLEAALVRQDVLAVVRAVVEHPDINKPLISRGQLAALAAVTRDQLNTWPDDAGAWIGDRALGMHAYELVRAGLLGELLTEEEIERFEAEKILDQLPAAAMRNVNRDELYYLLAMRKVIEGCKRPFFERRSVLAEIADDLQAKRDSLEFPVVAGRILLVDLEGGHAIQAADRARVEAWALALSLAAGDEPSGLEISPLTGKKYLVEREAGVIRVWPSGDRQSGDLPVVVPDLAGIQSE